MSKGCGCQSGIFKHLKPPYAKLFHFPCCIHDDGYDLGGGKLERKIEDRTLFMNCIKTVLKNYKNPWKMMWLFHIAMLYYVMVRLFGKFFFHYQKS